MGTELMKGTEAMKSEDGRGGGQSLHDRKGVREEEESPAPEEQMSSSIHRWVSPFGCYCQCIDFISGELMTWSSSLATNYSSVIQIMATIGSIGKEEEEDRKNQ